MSVFIISIVWIIGAILTIAFMRGANVGNNKDDN